MQDWDLERSVCALGTTLADQKYKAFLSYSHKDERWARWLHKRLETYRIPAHLIKSASDATKIPSKLSPIFRDREELAAADNLGEKIQAALAGSETLIIICSPNAAKSHWVNQEILFFKHNNRSGKILSVIVDGEPFADGKPGLEECLPEGLRFEVDTQGALSSTPAEPLAADLRPQGDGKRLGLLKLISGMLGVGLDELVQRDLQRARRRVTTITSGAVGIVLAMGTLTWFAVQARWEADARRADAEGQIEFMLTDLKDKLEPVGRLDALQVVGVQAAKYYDQYPMSEHTDDALGRRARVFHYLGEIQSTLGDLSEADIYFQKAYLATEDLLARDPNNADRIFDHAQSAFWVANKHFESSDYQDAHPYYESYWELSNQLIEEEPDKLRSHQEFAFATRNLGSNYFYLGDLTRATPYLEQAVEARKKVIDLEPQNVAHMLLLAGDYDWLSESTIFETSMAKSRHSQGLALGIRENYLLRQKDDLYTLSKTVNTLRISARLALVSGDREAARMFLKKAGSRSSHLIRHDKQNTDWLVDAINVNLMRAEMALVEGESARARTLLNQIDGKLTNGLENESIDPAILWRTRIQHASIGIHLNVAEGNINEARTRLDRAISIVDEVGDMSLRDAQTQHDPIPISLLQYLFTGNEANLETVLTLVDDPAAQIYPTYLSNIKAVTDGFNWGNHHETARERIQNLEYGEGDIFAKTKNHLSKLIEERSTSHDSTITHK